MLSYLALAVPPHLNTFTIWSEFFSEVRARDTLCRERLPGVTELENYLPSRPRGTLRRSDKRLLKLLAPESTVRYHIAGVPPIH